MNLIVGKPRTMNTPVNQTGSKHPMDQVSSKKFFMIFTAQAHTLKLQLAPSPLHAIFFAVASSSSMNSNVSKLCRDAEDFEESGPRQCFVSHSEGVENWQNNRD